MSGIRSSNSYMTADEFATAVGRAPPGGRVCYAIGDLANAAKHPAVFALRLLAQRYYSEGAGLLTQKRRSDLPAARGGACFEYYFTKASAADG
jgi:hypothetical protein